jgi:hypothetical protein
MTKAAFRMPLLIVTLLVLGFPSLGRTQSVIDFTGQPRIALGPVGLTPALSLNGVGIDNNVFNEAEDAKQDFTATLAPSLDTWVRAGRLAGRLRSNVDVVYFKRFSDQGGVNISQNAALALRIHRLTPFVIADYLNTRERPALDIDTRVRRQNLSVGAGIQAALGPRLSLRVEGQQQRTRFDDDALYEGASLHEQLNETVLNLTGSVQYALTPLTRLVLAAQRQRNRFELSPFRDADTLRVSPGVEFAPSALIRGRASVGVRVFNPDDTRVPDFTGIVASVDLGYTHRGVTQLGFRVDRDVAYSFSPDAPYSVQTSVNGSITRRLSGTWDITGSAGRQLLGYRQLEGATVASLHLDPAVLAGAGSALVYGAGAGLRFGRGSRLAFNVEYSARPAGLAGRYENLRYFTTVSYAL